MEFQMPSLKMCLKTFKSNDIFYSKPSLWSSDIDWTWHWPQNCTNGQSILKMVINKILSKWHRPPCNCVVSTPVNDAHVDTTHCQGRQWWSQVLPYLFGTKPPKDTMGSCCLGCGAEHWDLFWTRVSSLQIGFSSVYSTHLRQNQYRK